MAEKTIDSTFKTTLLALIEAKLSKMGVPATTPTEVVDVDITEYNGRMRINGMDKFKAVSFGSYVNFYAAQADLDAHKNTKGVLLIYIDSENASKLYKGLGLPMSEDEDDASMMAAAAEFCKGLAEEFKNELKNIGYGDLVISPPRSFRNSIMEGVEYNKDQKSKAEMSFFYWKRKSLVAELAIGSLGRK